MPALLAPLYNRSINFHLSNYLSFNSAPLQNLHHNPDEAAGAAHAEGLTGNIFKAPCVRRKCATSPARLSHLLHFKASPLPPWIQLSEAGPWVSTHTPSLIHIPASTSDENITLLPRFFHLLQNLSMVSGLWGPPCSAQVPHLPSPLCLGLLQNYSGSTGLKSPAWFQYLTHHC